MLAFQAVDDAGLVSTFETTLATFHGKREVGPTAGRGLALRLTSLADSVLLHKPRGRLVRREALPQWQA